MSKIFTLFGDGGSRGNPGPAASGYVVYIATTTTDTTDKTNLPQSILNGGLGSHKIDLNNLGEKVLAEGKLLGHTTNNQAEWQALTLGLKALLNYCIKNHIDPKNSTVEVFMDSLLVVQQAKGVYKVKNLDLKPHLLGLRVSQANFERVNFYHIYREFNKEADALVNSVLDNQ